MATDQLINKAQGDAIISGLTAIKNAINDQPVPTQIEDVVADAFDVGVAYVPGDYCIYENKLYICDAPHHGAWDGNDFTLTTVGAELVRLQNDLNKNNLGTAVNLKTYSSSSPYTCPSDGYAYIAGDTSAGTAPAILYIRSNNDGLSMPMVTGVPAGGVRSQLVCFVRKGMKLYPQAGYLGFMMQYYPLV